MAIFFSVVPADRCGKCGSIKVWNEIHEGQVLLRCLCGWSKWIVIQASVGAKLPPTGTQLYLLIVTLGNRNRPATTQQLATETNNDSGKVGTWLGVLQARGLIVKLKDRKGKAGGSIWDLSTTAQELITALN